MYIIRYCVNLLKLKMKIDYFCQLRIMKTMKKIKCQHQNIKVIERNYTSLIVFESNDSLIDSMLRQNTRLMRRIIFKNVSPNIVGNQP